MIDYLVRLIFSYTPLREAIFDEVHMYDSVAKALEDPEPGAGFWSEEDGWRGYSHNIDMNKYFFNDIPEFNLTYAMEELHKMEGAISLE